MSVLKEHDLGSYHDNNLEKLSALNELGLLHYEEASRQPSTLQKKESCIKTAMAM